MADMIALLIVTLSTLFGSNASDEQYSALLTKAVREKKPVPMEEVQVECSDCSPQAIGEIGFSFAGLTLAPLLIRSASIDVESLHHDKAGKLTMDGIRWTADITDHDLTDALQSHVARLKDATVKIDEQGLTLSGNYPLLGIAIPYSVRGTLGVARNSQLLFVIDESRLSGMPLPQGLNALIEKEVNPVYDLKAFAKRSQKDIERARAQLGYEFALQIEEIEYGEGHIIVGGSA